MPISLKENLAGNIRKESRKDMKKLEPGMINNHGIKCEPNYNINMEEEICETNDILLKNYQTDETNRNNAIITKYEDTVDNYCTKKEITEELIIKNEPCLFENDEKVNVQGEQSYNNDIQLLIEDEYIPGCSFSNSKSIIDTQNQMEKLQISRKMNNKQFKCNKCFETFNSGNELETHNHIQICQNKFEYSHSSDRHASTQNDKRPYKCEACKKSFKRPNPLIKHARSHIGEKPYKCDICNKTFLRKYNLTRHLRNHPGEKPFACDICNKTFKTKDQSIVHKRRHTGEQPFK